jgi:hypothetical protein
MLAFDDAVVAKYRCTSNSLEDSMTGEAVSVLIACVR